MGVTFQMLRQKGDGALRIAVNEVTGKDMKKLLVNGDVVLKFNNKETEKLEVASTVGNSATTLRRQVKEIATRFAADLKAKEGTDDRKLLIRPAAEAAAQM